MNSIIICAMSVEADHGELLKMRMVVNPHVLDMMRRKGQVSCAFNLAKKSLAESTIMFEMCSGSMRYMEHVTLFLPAQALGKKLTCRWICCNKTIVNSYGSLFNPKALDACSKYAEKANRDDVTLTLLLDREHPDDATFYIEHKLDDRCNEEYRVFLRMFEEPR